MKKNEPLKIGRVARNIERSLGISLTGETAIYISGKMLDEIAAKRPNGYLAYIEQISGIIRNPDFVAFSAEREELVFQKTFIKDAYVQAVYVVVGRKKKPICWNLSKVASGPRIGIGEDLQEFHFVRAMPKNVQSKAQ